MLHNRPEKCKGHAARLLAVFSRARRFADGKSADAIEINCNEAKNEQRNQDTECFHFELLSQKWLL